MPLGGGPIAEDDLRTIIQWIREGAVENAVTNVRRVDDAAPEDFGLSQNYPNPFNPATSISFQSPIQSSVNIALYSVSGQRIGTLVEDLFQPGTYRVTISAGGLPSGVYFYRLTAGSFSSVKRMVLMR